MTPHPTGDARPPDRTEELPAVFHGPPGPAPGGGDAAGAPESGHSRRRRRPLRTSLIALAAMVVVGAAGVAATGAMGGGGDGPAAASASGPTRTADVEKTTLTSSQTVDGTLGYGDTSVVQAPPAVGAPAPGNGSPVPPAASMAPRGMQGAPAGRFTGGTGGPGGPGGTARPPAGGPPAPSSPPPPTGSPTPSSTPTPSPSAPGNSPTPSGSPAPTPSPSPGDSPAPTSQPALSSQLAATGPIDASGPAAGGSPPAAGQGVLTGLPGEGQMIRRGQTVYSVDEQDVPLLYGSTPLYRTVGAGAEGDDVALLEKNLSALGYTGFTVDDTYDSGTAAAVKDWQHDLGRKETGTVQPGDAVIAPGARRVTEVKANLGAALAGDLLTWTGTERMVTVNLDTQYEDLVKEGTKASVKLPDGGTVDATVTQVGTAATAEPPAAGSPAGGSGGGSGDATLPVDLAIKDQNKLGRYQSAPVDVTLTAQTRQDVLAVPVNALIARPGGGYAVQAVTGTGVEDRTVKVGLFAGGLVEISGAGITEGLKVGIPQ